MFLVNFLNYFKALFQQFMIDNISLFIFSKTFGRAIVVAGGIGINQNNLDSVEILRMDKGDTIDRVNKFLSFNP